MEVCARKSWRSLSDHPLEGTRLVRQALMDEAGISRNEPWVVVSSVLMNADVNLAPVEDFIANLIEAACPPQYRIALVFHAYELYWGSSKYLQHLSETDRFMILGGLAAIPARFDIPVLVSATSRKHIDEDVDEKMFDPLGGKLTGIHVLNFCHAAVATERWMRENTKGEVAELILENTNESRTVLNGVSNMLRYGDFTSKIEGWWANYLPLKLIRGGAMFANKHDRPALVVADVCAYIVKRHLLGDPKVRDMYEVLKPKIANLDSFVIGPEP